MQSVSGRDRWFSGDPERPFRDDAPLSAGYQRLIIDWLTGGDIGQGATWHSAMALDARRLAYFEQKALTILNEHLLAIRLRASGCRLVDVTWLWSRVGGSLDGLDWDTPWWRQIAERTVDSVHVGSHRRFVEDRHADAARSRQRRHRAVRRYTTGFVSTGGASGGSSE